MKLKDLFEYANTPDSSGRYVNPGVVRRRSRLNSRRDNGYGEGLEGKRPKAGDPAYMKAYRRGREDRLHYKKHGSSQRVGESYQPPMLTPAQAQSVRDLISGAGMDWDDGAEEVLYRIFCDTNEMPYGVAKARTGDPSEWIYSRLSRMKPAELEQFLNNHTAQ